jgi:hypothetical protein
MLQIIVEQTHLHTPLQLAPAHTTSVKPGGKKDCKSPRRSGKKKWSDSFLEKSD